MAPTDEQWTILEPLVEACRPHAKDSAPVSAPDNRRDLLAARQRHEVADSPAEEGYWWMAAQTFIRWSRLGVWERLFTLTQEPGVGLGMTFLDGNLIRAHQKAAGAARKARQRRSGTSVRRLV
jgi:transposase